MPFAIFLGSLLIAMSTAAAAAPAQTIPGADPLLQSQFARPRCWGSAEAAAQWARGGRQAGPWRAEPATSGPRWSPAGDRCSLDRATGLTWASGAMRDSLTWADTPQVTAYANQQQLCGHADWRLPTRAELIALVDYRAPSADAMPGLPQDYLSYWTSSVQQRDHQAIVVKSDWQKPGVSAPTVTLPHGHYTVTLASGRVDIAQPTDRRAALLVRDAACRALGGAYWW